MKKFLKPKKLSHLKQGTKMHPITCEVFKRITTELPENCISITP